MNFDDVLDCLKSKLYLEEPDYTRLVFGMWITSKFDHNDPIWLIVQAAPSDCKTEIFRTLEGEQTRWINSLTKNSLLSGANPKDPNRQRYDLAPKLNHKLVVIPDFSNILSQDPKDRNAIFSQLRDLYDGHMSKTFGHGVHTEYTNLRTTILAASTTAFDSYQNEQTILGSRHLTFRLDTKDTGKILTKIDENDDDNSMRIELNKVVQEYLTSLQINEDITIPDDYKIKVQRLAELISILRCGVLTDTYTREVSLIPHPEKPARIYKMMRTLWKGIKNISETEDEAAFRILCKIAWGSSTEIRLKVFLRLCNSVETLSISKLADELLVGKNTIKKEVNSLFALEFADRITQTSKFTPGDEYYVWKASNKARNLLEGVTSLGNVYTTLPLSTSSNTQSGNPSININNNPPLVEGWSKINPGSDGRCAGCGIHAWREFLFSGNFYCRGCYDAYQVGDR